MIQDELRCIKIHRIFRIIITQTIQIYKLPRLKAINTIIAGPAVITRKRATSCSKVVKLKNIIKSPIIKSVYIFLSTYV